MSESQVFGRIGPAAIDGHDVVNRPCKSVWPVQSPVDLAIAQVAGPSVSSAEALDPRATVDAPAAFGAGALSAAVLSNTRCAGVELNTAGRADAGGHCHRSVLVAYRSRFWVSVGLPAVVVRTAEPSRVLDSRAPVNGTRHVGLVRVVRRISESAPSLVVSAAPAADLRVFVAAFDRAFDLRLGRLRRGRDALRRVVVLLALVLRGGLAVAAVNLAHGREHGFRALQRVSVRLEPAVVLLAPRAFPARSVAPFN